MFLGFNSVSVSMQCFPRIRGDVPAQHLSHPIDNPFSPHTRGCSSEPHSIPLEVKVFPAYAGMFRVRFKVQVEV